VKARFNVFNYTCILLPEMSAQISSEFDNIPAKFRPFPPNFELSRQILTISRQISVSLTSG
jgi:hypothetical protein